MHYAARYCSARSGSQDAHYAARSCACHAPHLILLFCSLCAPPHSFPTPLQDVLRYYGATKYGTGPVCLGVKSPRESYNPEAEDFMRERGSYQNYPEDP